MLNVMYIGVDSMEDTTADGVGGLRGPSPAGYAMYPVSSDPGCKWDVTENPSSHMAGDTNKMKQKRQHLYKAHLVGMHIHTHGIHTHIYSHTHIYTHTLTHTGGPPRNMVQRMFHSSNNGGVW